LKETPVFIFVLEKVLLGKILSFPAIVSIENICLEKAYFLTNNQWQQAAMLNAMRVIATYKDMHVFLQGSELQNRS